MFYSAVVAEQQMHADAVELLHPVEAVPQALELNTTSTDAGISSEVPPPPLSMLVPPQLTGDLPARARAKTVAPSIGMGMGRANPLGSWIDPLDPWIRRLLAQWARARKGRAEQVPRPLPHGMVSMTRSHLHEKREAVRPGQQVAAAALGHAALLVGDGDSLPALPSGKLPASLFFLLLN